MNNKEVMSTNIRYYLDLKGLNVKNFATQLGFKYTTVLDWVNGNSYPRIDKVEKMAKYFGISKASLIEEHKGSLQDNIALTWEDHEVPMTLANHIKIARVAKHYTQKDLAELMNVKSTTVSGWELGRNEPSIETLKKLAQKLDVSFSYLAGVEDNSNDDALTWEDLGMPYKGKIPDELKATYADIAKGYFKRHPEYLNKD